MVEHLYFHIPFCAKRCPYCSFYVETSFREKNRRFVDALLADVEAAARTAKIAPKSIFLGGGTPSALSIAELEHFFEGLRQRMDLSRVTEWTIEINPSTVSPEKAALLLANGVHRVSMGVQSWDDEVLKTLGRNHTRDKALRTYEVLRNAGFKNIGLDLMFAIPGQTLKQWRETLAYSVSLAPEHISSYCLTYEEDTDFFQKLGAGIFSQDDERDREMFEITMDVLQGAGYSHYEISNYSLPGFESTHNHAYWTGADFLGFGPSAFSTIGGKRWQQIADVTEYTRRVFAQESTVAFEEELSPEKKRGETLGLQLRTAQGVERSALVAWADEVQEFMDLGLLMETGERVRLTRAGKLLADSVAELFV